MVSRLAVLTAVVVVLVGGSASAHEHRDVRGLALTVGWLNEPTYSGSVNAVQIEVAKGGSPVTDAKLKVVVLFGPKTSTTRSAELTLNGSDEKPGEYTAAIIPSRPGTYTFHITGTAAGSNVDQFFTSSETTFDDPKDPTVDEFPVKDPTTGQLAARLDSTESGGKSTKTMSTIALVVGGLGLIVGIAAIARKRG